MLKPIIFLISLVATCCANAQPVETELQLDTMLGKISGTLTVPQDGSATWVVLMIGGSGPTDRDGNNPHAVNNSFKMLAHSLAGAGIASVRYDKRGVGASAAAAAGEDQLRFNTYVDDAAAWIELLKSTRRFARIAILGHSEGALTAMLAAKSAKPQAYISIAGTGRKASDVLRAQMAGKLPDDLAKENERILSSLENDEKVTTVPAALLTLYRPGVQPYLISWFKHNPTQILQTISVPILLIQGTTDIQVELRDFEMLSEAVPTATRRTIPGMNHILKLVDSDRSKQIASYNDGSLPISPTVITTIGQFLASIPANNSK